MKVLSIASSLESGAQFEYRTRARSVVVAVLVFLVIWLAPVSAVVAQEDCLECHDDVDVDQVAESIHGFLECLDCHPAGEAVPHSDRILANECVTCHDDVGEEYARSIHGWLKSTGDPLVDGCSSCHGKGHDIRGSEDPESPTHDQRLAETCGVCHASPELAARSGIHIFRPLSAYTDSIHARALKEGKNAATCSDCHGSHSILRASDPLSSVNRLHIAQTCGECHVEIDVAYEQSVHGRAAAEGVRESPTCIDCHGEHRILEPRRRDSPVYPTNIPKMICGRCHSDIHLSEKFGISADRVPAYEDSYHGLAARAGRITVANCASCHGVHDILPSSDPASHIHPDHLAATCGQCHAGAGERFAIGPVHILPEEPAYPAVYWVRRIYIWLIVGTIGFMLLHNGLDLYRKMRNPPYRPVADAVEQRQRLSIRFRLAHGLLAGSFIVLVHSGFALTYPESWWAAPFLSWEGQYGIRGWVHRSAAVVMLLAGVIHIIHLARDRQARGCILGMIPGRDDWHEFKERIAYFLGRREHPPKSPWIGYPEKLEYLAVVWGTLVMAATGFALWFENVLLRWLPSWVADLATTIHFWEAVLASLAILVWHFYAVIFDPVVYPGDPAWLTGRSAPGRAFEREAPEEPSPDTEALSFEDSGTSI